MLLEEGEAMKTATPVIVTRSNQEEAVATVRLLLINSATRQ